MKKRTLLRFAVIAAMVAFIFTSCSKKDSILNSQTVSQTSGTHSGTNDPSATNGTVQAEFTQYQLFPISIVATDANGVGITPGGEAFADANGVAKLDLLPGTYTITAHAYTDQYQQDYQDVVITGVTVDVNQLIDLGTITFK